MFPNIFIDLDWLILLPHTPTPSLPHQLQVFLSRRNPLLNWHLPFFQRLWYSYAAWAPISTAITVPSECLDVP
jgi:hypothetical protein